ncbi:transposase [Myxococcus qinghaiensis]|uniref:transposase n=1 Tax=Myxococcus qinghaiensis TaxID=2906758 RepID=UPI003899526F
MVRGLAPDAFWERVTPLLPPPRPKKKLGRPQADDRAAMEAIVVVLQNGIPWERVGPPRQGRLLPRLHCLLVRPGAKRDVPTQYSVAASWARQEHQ